MLFFLSKKIRQWNRLLYHHALPNILINACSTFQYPTYRYVVFSVVSQSITLIVTGLLIRKYTLWVNFLLIYSLYGFLTQRQSWMLPDADCHSSVFLPSYWILFSNMLWEHSHNNVDSLKIVYFSLA